MPWTKRPQFRRRQFFRAFSRIKDLKSILIQISMKFVPSGPIDNTTALVQLMAGRRTSDKS